ncbi:DEAD/DEAH box helicase family protein [Candidatus Pacearchaeota archaeon]|nr:DEAD/DEAH box helicase family protein [Candidatus Pacearchaeota archaeon]
MANSTNSKENQKKSQKFENLEDNVTYDGNLKITESFFDDENQILKKILNKEFEKREVFDLRMNAKEASMNSKIDELISYPLIKKRLAYNLPHQQEGALRILRELDGRALLADEVGLGKTITSGMVLKECIVRGFIKRVLILTPPSLINQWKEELRSKFELEFKDIETEKDWEDAEYAIASIDRIKNFNTKTNKFKHSQAHEIYWDLIIIDEAHKLKDKKTFRWKFVDKLQKKRLLLLTATPFQNNLIELYNLLALLRRGHLGTLSQFRRKFLYKGSERRPMNPEELKQKLGEVIVRRRRDEVTGIKYMKRIPKIHSLELTKEERIIYDDVLKLLSSNYFDSKGEPIKSTLAMHSILPKITSSSKSSMEFLDTLIKNPKYSEKTKNMAREILDDFKELKKDTKISCLLMIVEKILSEDKKSKILIYTKHPATLKYISGILKQKKLKIVEFLGGLTSFEKSKRINEFSKKGQILVSTETGSEGLNFQFCNNLINYDLPWNPMVVEQRIGRMDRIGQKKDMNIYSLATKDTMEEHVVNLIINKMCCIGLIMGELPIILFNMGLDGKGKSGSTKFEEKIMRAYLYSENNLTRFSTEIDKVEQEINNGISEYSNTKLNTKELFR